MHVSGDAAALVCQRLLVLQLLQSPKSPDTSHMNGCNSSHDERQDQEIKRACLPNVRPDSEGKDCFCLVPDAVAVGGLDSESIISRTEVGKESQSEIGEGGPIPIITIQAVPEANPVRSGKGDGSELDFHAST
jgi:hypothetical protein